MKPSILRLFITSLIFILISATSAHAVKIDDKGAAQLKDMLNKHIENYRTSIEQSGGKLITDGDITIEQGTGYYAATLPATTYQTVLGSNIKMGLIAINAIPTDNADQWKMSMAIPTPILIKDEKDVVIQRIDIGEQNMGGLWSSKLENFAKLKATYNNIKLTIVDADDSFAIDKLQIVSDLDETKDGFWSGPTNFSMDNVKVGPTSATEGLNLGSFTGVINVENFSPSMQKEAMAKIQSLDEKTAKTDAPNIILNLIKSSGNINAQFNLKDLKINDVNNKNNSLSAIDLIQFGFTSETPEGDKINQGFNLAYNGVKFKEGAKDTALIPTEFKTNIKLENFPFLDVMNFATDAVGNNKDPNAKQVAAAKAMSFLPQKLKEAGAILTLKDTNWGNDTYNVSIDGLLKAEPQSQVGGSGYLNIITTGLEDVTTELNKTESGARMAPQLGMFSLISEKEGDKNVARIKLDEKGNISVNGKDMSGLMGGGAPAQ